MRRKNTQEKTIANVFKKLHWTCKDAECFFSGITTIRITYSGTYKKVDSIYTFATFQAKNSGRISDLNRLLDYC